MKRRIARLAETPGFFQSASTARVIALIGVSTQVVAFMIKIGLELTWRPVAMALELALCFAVVVAAVRWRRGWPLVLIAFWQVVLAGMIWVASRVFYNTDCIPAHDCSSGFQGPDGWEKTASFSLFAGAVLLIASASALWQIRLVEGSAATTTSISPRQSFSELS